MVDANLLSNESILDYLKTHYGIKGTSIIPRFEGADMSAALYRFDALDRSSYFVKLKIYVDNSIVEGLHKSGIKEVIPPLKTTSGDSFLKVEGLFLLVYPFLEGVSGFTQKLSKKQWVKLGKALRQVHEFKLPEDILKDIREEDYSSKWRQFVYSLYETKHHIANDDAIAQQFLSYIQKHQSVVERLVNRADQLCEEVKAEPAEFVLCHSDIHGGNVILDGEEAIYIVDWDEPIMAPKERDLMFIGGGVGNVWNDPKEEEWFYQGYGKTTIHPSLIAYYRHERIVQDIAEYAQALLLTNTGHKDRSEMFQHFLNLFSPRGVVEIALGSVI